MAVAEYTTVPVAVPTFAKVWLMVEPVPLDAPVEFVLLCVQLKLVPLTPFGLDSVNTDDCPEQILVAVGVTPIVGIGLTVTT